MDALDWIALVTGLSYNLNWSAQDGYMNQDFTCSAGTFRSTTGSIDAIKCRCTTDSDCPCGEECKCESGDAVCGWNSSAECDSDGECESLYWPGDWECVCHQCNPIGGSPILISLGTSAKIELTSADEGVSFDIDGDGSLNQIAWTALGSDEAFLALDRNANGQIDNGLELFGNYTSQPPSSERNGFSALAIFDQSENGGNEDGWITSDDSVFTSLQLWMDVNHDGISRTNELQLVQTSNILAIGLDYRTAMRKDKYGNTFRYVAQVQMDPEAKGPRRKHAIDVFLKGE